MAHTRWKATEVITCGQGAGKEPLVLRVYARVCLKNWDWLRLCAKLPSRQTSQDKISGGSPYSSAAALRASVPHGRASVGDFIASAHREPD
jgi:hypothetical protein